MKLTHCPKCKTQLCMSVQEIKGRMRPLKKPFLCCPTCRRIINTETGVKYFRNKLEK